MVGIVAAIVAGGALLIVRQATMAQGEAERRRHSPATACYCRAPLTPIPPSLTKVAQPISAGQELNESLRLTSIAYTVLEAIPAGVDAHRVANNYGHIHAVDHADGNGNTDLSGCAADIHADGDSSPIINEGPRQFRGGLFSMGSQPESRSSEK
jgi:hypothetical protein